MRSNSIFTIALASALAVASLSPALAAKAKGGDKSGSKAGKIAGACAQPNGRCISDCDATHWCVVNTCTNGQSTRMPFWRCFEPSGLCLVPHC
jgi:hypothetical protein